jgi:hypothetical protein
MRRRIWVLAVAVLMTTVAVGSVVAAADAEGSFSANLRGFQEIPTLSVAGRGTFSAEVTDDGAALSYTLTYSGLTGDALFAHIHLGRRATAGGVSAFLCGGGGKDACPGAGGTVTGVITADDVVGPEDQGISAGEFKELLTAMGVGATYVNVHTDAYPSGEIRGQIES